MVSGFCYEDKVSFFVNKAKNCFQNGNSSGMTKEELTRQLYYFIHIGMIAELIRNMIGQTESTDLEYKSAKGGFPNGHIRRVGANKNGYWEIIHLNI